MKSGLTFLDNGFYYSQVEKRFRFGVNGRTGKGPNNRMQKFHSALMYFWQKEIFLFDTMNSLVLNR